MKLNGTPNDLIQNLNPISIVIIIPIFDYGLYPWLRKMGFHFTPIKRIFVGFLFVGLAMVYAAVLQHYIYESSPCHNFLPSECVDEAGYTRAADINVWVVAGPYILVGIGEIFASITSLEYAFTKAPLRMKSVVVAFSQFQVRLILLSVPHLLTFSIPLTVCHRFRTQLCSYPSECGESLYLAIWLLCRCCLDCWLPILLVLLRPRSS